MSPLEAGHRTVARASAAMVLFLVLGTSLAQTAPANGLDAEKTNASVGAAPAVAPGGTHVSPHARAARERAAAQAATAASGVRVSPFTARRKPHKLTGGR